MVLLISFATHVLAQGLKGVVAADKIIFYVGSKSKAPHECCPFILLSIKDSHLTQNLNY